MNKQIYWDKKLEECKSAFDMLKLESEFLNNNPYPDLDKFYTDAWFSRIDSLLGRSEQFQDIETLKEEVALLKKILNSHIHRNGKVYIEYS